MSAPDFWPWWLGALTLGGFFLLHWWIEGRLPGVSGIIVRVITAVTHRRTERLEQALLANRAALEAALLAETAREFGIDASNTLPAASATEVAGKECRGILCQGSRLPWTGALVFLLAIPLGGLLSSGTVGAPLFATRDLGASFSAIFGGGFGAALVLFGGGVLIGAGARMAGGCTSGHGLSGNARLQPGSLLFSATFFAVGIAVSLLALGSG
jgi:hypothetical protein